MYKFKLTLNLSYILVNNSFTFTLWTKAILRNQLCADQRPVHAWFKKHEDKLVGFPKSGHIYTFSSIEMLYYKHIGIQNGNPY